MLEIDQDIDKNDYMFVNSKFKRLKGVTACSEKWKLCSNAMLISDMKDIINIVNNAKITRRVISASRDKRP